MSDNFPTKTLKTEFNDTFPIDFILKNNRFSPTSSSVIDTYLQSKLYSEYENDFYIVKIDLSPLPEYDKKAIHIAVWQKFDNRFLISLYSAYDCYRHFNCDQNENTALNWKNDSSLCQQSPQLNTSGFLPPPIYSPQYIPTFDLYQYFNQKIINHSLNLKSLMPGYLIQRMANYFSKKYNMPESTLILVGLGVFSGLTCRKWNCAYQDGETAPICLYVVAEQDASNGKSSVLNAFQKPFITMLEKEIEKIEDIILTKKENLKAHLDTEMYLEKEDRYQFKIKTKKLEAELNESKEKLIKINHILPKTNITSQALEESLNYTNGFFIATADEQSLIDSLVSNKGNTSNEVLLKGRNSERMQSLRLSRKGYSGKVTGSFVCFAQPSHDKNIGCVEKIIKASGATGLCERFLMISEPEIMNKDHLKDIPYPDKLFSEYAKKFNFLKPLIDKPLKHNELTTLKISSSGWEQINKFNNSLEKLISPHEIFSYRILKTMAKKSTLQIMSIASNLHLSECTEMPLNEESYIEDRFVFIAIEIMTGLFHSTRDYLERNGFIGNKDEIRSIIDYFIGTDGKYKRVKVSIHALEGRKFLGSGKRDLIRETLNFLLDTKNLIQHDDGTNELNPRIML